MFSRAETFISSVIKPFKTCLSRFLRITSIPFSRPETDISIKLTRNPEIAKACAIPFPMVPEPITEMSFMFW